MTKTIPLSQGKVALVDDEDFEWLSQWKWYAHADRRTYYAVRSTPRDENGRYTTVRMHRQILEAPLGIQVDHADSDGLNNQRANIRLCNNAENARNRRKRAQGTSSRFKGVSWSALMGSWRARIRVNSQDYKLGFFTNETEAAQAYNVAALLHYGRFASVNIIDQAD